MKTTLRPGIVASIAAFLATAALLTGCSSDTSEPSLILDDTVAADLADLATATFDEFVAGAPGIAPCIGSIRLMAAVEHGDLASYSAARSTITVRVPATAPSLRDSLVHELAHHVEVACSSHQAIRSDFLTAQGHSPGQDWFIADAWEETPSEQFAEAVVATILGERQRNLGGIQLEPGAVAVVAGWLRP